MSNRAVLLKEIETLPAACLGEVMDFVAWIKQRKLSLIPETMLLNETALAKDWDTPEEDEAWARATALCKNKRQEEFSQRRQAAKNAENYGK